MRELARYKIHAFILLFGFCIASVMFSYSAGIMVNKEAEQKDIEACEYEYTACFCASPTADVSFERDVLMEDMLDMLDNTAGTDDIVVRTGSFDINIGAHGRCLAYIVFPGQMPKYHLVKGKFPTEEQLRSDGRYVVLGINRKDAAYKKAGKDYILIQGEEYEVTGYISAERSRILDNEVLLFYDCVGDSVKKNLLDPYMMNALPIVYESDTDSETYTYMLDYITHLGGYPEEKQKERYNVTVVDFMPIWYTTSEPLSAYAIWAKLIYAFCIILLFYVMDLWMQQRRKEFAIRKACGYSGTKIMGLVMGQTAKLLVVAVVLSELIISFLIFADVGIYVLNTRDIFDRVMRELLFVISTFILVSIIPFIRIYTEKPADLLQNI